MAFRPYLVEFKGGTAVTFYKDGKVRSGTLSTRQDLIQSIEPNGGDPRYRSVDAGQEVEFDHNGFILAPGDDRTL
ncbi:MAG TPA: hypothetical protein PLW80_10295 [Spirochaetales bacterium]|nr:hypothetical protein [Spirochaetales bacterium]HPB66946.1 hypothetical protein [Spirochaetales bacterium]HPM73334.1 hypothetical protein [Spirochaetales bacterium]HQO65723.1 hypothetical protein [Spirochaetales bacterium]